MLWCTEDQRGKINSLGSRTETFLITFVLDNIIRVSEMADEVIAIFHVAKERDARLFRPTIASRDSGIHGDASSGPFRVVVNPGVHTRARCNQRRHAGVKDRGVGRVSRRRGGRKTESS
jgi:hypothetical protein